MAKPSKHIESGTTDKVTRKGAPRQPVTKVSRPDDVDDTVEDDLEVDETETETDSDDAATDAATPTTGTRARRRHSGDPAAKGGAKGTDRAAPTSTSKGGVRKVDRKTGRAQAKPSSKHTSKRVTEKGTASRSGPAQSARYTPPTAKFEDMPSPIWVPILMFGLFLLGMLAIFLNYVALLPGATSNWYLLVGLGFILAGIITATQYR